MKSWIRILSVVCLALCAGTVAALPPSSTQPAMLCEPVIVQDSNGNLYVYTNCQPSASYEAYEEGDYSGGCYYGEDCYDNYVEYP